jgi:2-polyprenyl-3-methyl-5-hydroxy-6-metoxy-1,4-benzoquinol methylase
MHSVKQQYERFPYPPISALALPRRDQGQGLRYECATALAEAAGLPAITPQHHNGLRILIAGAGTLEPLVVAQQHPQAAEIVAVDLSRRSLARLQRRITLARLLRGWRLPPMRLIEGDITEWQGGEFDYIIASNVLHHTADPARTLNHLSSMLKPGGVMRIVTYAKMSRFWINQTSAWLRWHGLCADTPRLQQQAREVINQLPHDHPIRSCFTAHVETTTATGLVDAFFHSCERPLSPLQWQRATESAGLQWLGETQSELAQGKFLLELLPQTAALTAWQRLQLMDDLLELNTSPILWFCKRGGVVNAIQDDVDNSVVIAEMINTQQLHWSLPSQIYWQLGQSLHRADALLHTIGSSITQLLTALRDEVGPRVNRDDQPLPGLTMTEYPVEQLLTALQPPSLQQLGDGCIEYRNTVVPGNTLSEQMQWLQLRYGHEQAQIGPLHLR